MSLWVITIVFQELSFVRGVCKQRNLASLTYNTLIAPILWYDDRTSVRIPFLGAFSCDVYLGVSQKKNIPLNIDCRNKYYNQFLIPKPCHLQDSKLSLSNNINNNINKRIKLGASVKYNGISGEQREIKSFHNCQRQTKQRAKVVETRIFFILLLRNGKIASCLSKFKHGE